MNTENQKSDWQAALQHHEQLCVERSRALEAQFAAIDSKFTAIDAKFVAIDAKFTAIDARFKAVDVRFDAVEKRLDNIEKLQRFTIGAILAWPPLLMVAIKLFS